MRDNKGDLLCDEDELTAWLDKRPAQGALSVRDQGSALVSAQAHISELTAELNETRQWIQVIDERLAGVERLILEKNERLAELRDRAEKAEARAEKAEERADRATRKGWWPWS